MKIVKKDYPFTIIVENKVSKAGNKYLSIGLGITEKNPNATCDEEKYNTKWFNFIDERDLLKLQAVANGAYLTLKEEQENGLKIDFERNKSIVSNTTNTVVLKDKIVFFIKKHITSNSLAV